MYSGKLYYCVAVVSLPFNCCDPMIYTVFVNSYFFNYSCNFTFRSTCVVLHTCLINTYMASIKIENTLLLCIASQLYYDHKVTSAATCIVKELLDDIVNPVN